MKFCCVIHNSNEEAIDFILGASAFFDDITVILMDEGITMLQNKSFQVLKEYGIHSIKTLTPESLPTIKTLISTQDFLFHF